MSRVHSECTSECRHEHARNLGRFFTAAADKDRWETESALAALHSDKTIEYLGLQGPSDHLVHTWRVGAEPWHPLPCLPESDEGRPTKVGNILFRREVWEGDGPPGPVDFSREAEAVTEQFPAPLITSNQPDQAPAPPAPICALAEYAAAQGWDHMLTYARGWMPHAKHGRPSANAKQSWAVRLRRGPFRAVAVRLDGAWASMWTWSDRDRFTHHRTLEAFKEAIR